MSEASDILLPRADEKMIVFEGVCDRDSDQILWSILTKLSVTVFWRQTSVESVNGQNCFNSLKNI